MNTGSLFLISAPSGAGKTSLVKSVLEADSQISVCVSHTTRAMRDGEHNGENYYFTDDIEFDRMIQSGEFLEHADVFGRRYGSSRQEVDDRRAKGQDVILEIDWQGADQVRALMPDAVSIFILPPSISELEQRLRTRGQDSEQAMDTRLAEAKTDINQAARYDYLIVNDEFGQAHKELLSIIHAARLRRERQMQQSSVAVLLR